MHMIPYASGFDDASGADEGVVAYAEGGVGDFIVVEAGGWPEKAGGREDRVAAYCHACDWWGGGGFSVGGGGVGGWLAD